MNKTDFSATPEILWNNDTGRPATLDDLAKDRPNFAIAPGRLHSLPPAVNTSGVYPLDLRVLVLPDSAEAVTKGGIILPEPEVDKQKFAQCKATIIAVGENAFHEARRNPDFVKPAPGDRVLIAKYHGVMIVGDDGGDYRLLNDEDVTARLEER